MQRSSTRGLEPKALQCVEHEEQFRNNFCNDSSPWKGFYQMFLKENDAICTGYSIHHRDQISDLREGKLILAYGFWIQSLVMGKLCGSDSQLAW